MDEVKEENEEGRVEEGWRKRRQGRKGKGKGRKSWLLLISIFLKDTHVQPSSSTGLSGAHEEP